MVAKISKLVEVVALEKAGLGGVQVIAQQEFMEGARNVDSITFVCPVDEAPMVGDLLKIVIEDTGESKNG